MSEISLSLPSEGAEVTYGTRIQAKEQINGLKTPRKTLCYGGK